MRTRPGFPTWKYRYLRIRYVERDRTQFGFGVTWFRISGQVCLTVGQWDITWGRP